MTMTTTETCQQPCFCGRCCYSTVDNLIGDRAKLLQAALDDRLYENGFERQLADEIISAIPVSRRIEVLEHMLTWDHLMPRVMAVDCLLDETDVRSYEAVTEMSRILLDAIHAQGNEGSALGILVRNELCLREKMLRCGSSQPDRKEVRPAVQPAGRAEVTPTCIHQYPAERRSQ